MNYNRGFTSNNADHLPWRSLCAGVNKKYFGWLALILFPITNK